MIEHVKKLTEEALATVEEDGYDSDAAAVAECQHLGTISAKAWGAWVGK